MHLSKSSNLYLDHWRLGWGGMTILLNKPALYTNTLLSVALLLLLLLALLGGASWLEPKAVLAALLGQQDPATQMLVVDFRLPRSLVALLGGAALGLAGALLQAFCQNRLASPELLGLNDGASLALLGGLLASSSGLLGPWWLACLGALLAVLLLLVLSQGLDSRGQRLLVLGLGLAALARALLEFKLSSQELLHANAIYAWSQGQLNGKDWSAVRPLANGLGLMLPVILYASRPLALLRFDLELAHSLGLAVRRWQWFALLTACLMAGLALGSCGPLAFVALAAPLLADKLRGDGSLNLLGSALLGAVLVLSADILGRSLFELAELPAGVICKLLGGPFLLVLIYLDSRDKQ